MFFLINILQIYRIISYISRLSHHASIKYKSRENFQRHFLNPTFIFVEYVQNSKVPAGAFLYLSCSYDFCRFTKTRYNAHSCSVVLLSNASNIFCVTLYLSKYLHTLYASYCPQLCLRIFIINSNVFFK